MSSNQRGLVRNLWRFYPKYRWSIKYTYIEDITDDKVKLITSDYLDLSQNDKIDFVEGEVFNLCYYN